MGGVRFRYLISRGSRQCQRWLTITVTEYHKLSMVWFYLMEIRANQAPPGWGSVTANFRAISEVERFSCLFNTLYCLQIVECGMRRNITALWYPGHVVKCTMEEWRHEYGVHRCYWIEPLSSCHQQRWSLTCRLVYVYSMFALRKPHSLLILSGERGFLRVNSL